MFWNLDFLKNGDPVYVDRGGETYEYEVFHREVIEQYQWDKLKPRSNEDILTLLTCEPKRLPMTKRLLVDCRRVRHRDTNHKDEVKRKRDKFKDTYECKNDRVDPKIKLTKYSIFAITFLLLGLLLYFIGKFKIYLRA